MAEETRGGAFGDDSWKFRLALFLGLIALMCVGYAVAVMLVPRWWGQFMGNRIDGRMSVGTAYGLTIGFVFTVIPLFIARQAFRRMSWGMRGVVLALATVVSLPNLMTLGIVMGQGNGAHAGERILDVDGPDFRAASAFGAIGAAVVFVAGLGFAVWRSRE
jgi:hypothetical protein